MKELNELKIELSNRILEGRGLEKVAQDFWDETRVLQKELWLLENGMKIGDNVEVLDGKIWVKGEIIGMKIMYGYAIPVIKKLKKDGPRSLLDIGMWKGKQVRLTTPEEVNKRLNQND